MGNLGNDAKLTLMYEQVAGFVKLQQHHIGVCPAHAHNIVHNIKAKNHENIIEPFFLLSFMTMN